MQQQHFDVLPYHRVAAWGEPCKGSVCIHTPYGVSTQQGRCRVIANHPLLGSLGPRLLACYLKYTKCFVVSIRQDVTL